MANRVAFPDVSTSRIRVVLHHQPGATSGLTEIEAWSPDALPLPPAPAPRVPEVRASFTGASDRVEQTVDGRFTFTRYSRNRWTAFGTPNASDWLELDFGAPRAVERVDLYLYGDGRGVAAPRSVALERWDGSGWVALPVLERIPETPTAWALNTLVVSPVEASRIRVVFTHALPAASGVTEVRVWPR
jgi:hypothetical protein